MLLRKKGASLVASHGNFTNIRQNLYDAMKAKMDVLCPGNFARNVPPIGPTTQDKLNFIKHTIFNICPENTEFEGYFTEKIFQSFEGGCIPVYWAVGRPEPDIINEDCYCFGDFNDMERFKHKVDHVIANHHEYIDKKLFTDDAGKHIDKFYKTLKDQIVALLNKIESK